MPSSILNSDDGVISGTSGLKNSGGDDAVLLIQTNGTTAQTVDSGQRTMFPTTIGVGGATPSASGSGISFPASASASTDANTLDDYEEGTWTPALLGGSTAGTTTHSSQDGFYTKIGRVVTINCYIQISAMTGTGDLRLSGLPFTSSSAARAASSGMVNGLNWGGGTFLAQYIQPNNSHVEFWYLGDDLGWNAQQCVNESIGFIFSMSYIV
jgi:hypothetical protein